MGAGASKNGGEDFKKKVHNWKIPQGFLEKLKDLTKKPECFGGNKPQLPYTKNSLGISSVKKGVMGFRTT